MNIKILLIIGIIIIVAVLIVFLFQKLSSKKKETATTLKKGTKSAENNQVYIGNLAYGVTENDLRTFFQPYGMVSAIRIVRNSKTGRSKGFAFVTYKNITEVNQALAAHGKQLQGRRLVVRIAKTRT